MAETLVTVAATNRDVLDPYIKILQNRPNDIDVSFSSYLKPDNNNDEQQQQQEQQKEQEEDTELSIFEARRYFSEIGNNDRSQTKNLTDSRFSSVSSSKVSSFTLEHKTSSEASWNSQTGLLDNRKGSDRDHGRGSSKKGSLLGPRWFFRRRTCPCSSSKSVQVQETKSRIAESRTGSNRIVSNRIVHHNHQMISSSDPIRLTIPSNTVTRSSNFSFPTLNETSHSQTSENLKKPVLNPTKPVLNSIKPVLNPIKPVLNSTKPIMNPTNLKDINTDEESTSDASSDLFEIESFSRPWAPPAARDSIDETATEHGYEPSEASVTWSVTTAEPVSAVASNFSRISLSSSLASSGCDKTTGLLRCRCEQAVMVNSVQRLVQPFKSVSVQDDVIEKVLCNNGSSKLSVTTRTMLI